MGQDGDRLPHFVPVTPHLPRGAGGAVWQLSLNFQALVQQSPGVLVVSRCPYPPCSAPFHCQQKAAAVCRFNYGFPLSGIYMNLYHYTLVFFLSYYLRRMEKKRNFLLNISYLSNFSVFAKSKERRPPHTHWACAYFRVFPYAFSHLMLIAIVWGSWDWCPDFTDEETKIKKVTFSSDFFFLRPY